jgi:glycosyltransferase involved in cell wall biosynthesis
MIAVPKRILIVGNYTRNLRCFRGEVILALRRAKAEVVTMSPDADEWAETWLAEQGVRHIRSRFLHRSAMNAWGDLRFLAEVAGLIRDFRPDAVLTFTHKPNIYAGFASVLAGRGAPCSALVEGLGYAFIVKGDRKRTFVRFLLRAQYFLWLCAGGRLGFLNKWDREELGGPADRLRLGRIFEFGGVGVDTARFVPSQRRPKERPVVLTVARLLRSKGIGEFIAAAMAVRDGGMAADFVIVGAPDPGPDGLPMAEIKRGEALGLIRYLGQQDQLPDVYQNADIYVLASYREGVPVTVLEAMATGLPVVVTDVPGCIDLVQHEVNGLVVQVRNPAALAEAVTRLLADEVLRARLGRRGRIFVEESHCGRRLGENLAHRVCEDAGAADLAY